MGIQDHNENVVKAQEAMSDEKLEGLADQVRALFEEYDEKDREWDAAKVAVETATIARSAVVEKIAKLIAPRKKLMRNGQALTLVVRGNTFFWRGLGKEKDVFEV